MRMENFQIYGVHVTGKCICNSKKKKKKEKKCCQVKMSPRFLTSPLSSGRRKLLIPQAALFSKNSPRKKEWERNYVNYRSGNDVLVRKTWKAINSYNCL